MKAVTQEQVNRKKLFTTKEMVTVSLLSALAYVLMLFEIPFINYLGFLKLDLSDIPAIVGGIAYGPIAGVFIELIKNLIKAITATETAWIGELANFLVSLGYIIPVAVIFNKFQFKRKALVAFACGTLGMMLAGCLVNYFITLPLYAEIMGGMDKVVTFASAGLSYIKDVPSLVILGITPFNFVKGIFISILGYYTYIVIRKSL